MAVLVPPDSRNHRYALMSILSVTRKRSTEWPLLRRVPCNRRLGGPGRSLPPIETNPPTVASGTQSGLLTFPIVAAGAAG